MNISNKSKMKTRVGRPIHNLYTELNFIHMKINNKNCVLCKLCRQIMKNTASIRLKAHRRVCRNFVDGIHKNDIRQRISLEQLSKNLSENNSEYFTEIFPELTKTIIQLPENYSDHSTSTGDLNVVKTEQEDDVALKTAESVNNYIAPPVDQEDIQKWFIATEPTATTSYASPSSSNQIIFPTNFELKSPEICKAKSDCDKINEALANFFYGCNIPFDVIESDHFKEFIKKLQPDYELPARKLLSTKLLDNAYNDYINNLPEKVESDTVLIINVLENSLCHNFGIKSKNMTSFLHLSDNSQIFLKSRDVDCGPEDEEEFTDIVEESIDIVKSKYNSNVYAVVSNDIELLVTLGYIEESFWSIPCGAHLLNKGITQSSCFNKIQKIIKEFQHPELIKIILEKGGHLEDKSYLYSDLNASTAVLLNRSYMMSIVAEKYKYSNGIDPVVRQLLFDSDFFDEVQHHAKLLNQLLSLKNSSIADALDIWFTKENLKCAKENFKPIFDSFNYRSLETKPIKNKYSLTAYFLHPFYDNARLSKSDLDIIITFLMENLNADGISDLDAFRNRTGLFGDLFNKNLKDPLVFWRVADMKHATLSVLAIKLLKIPASVGKFERIFTNLSYVHSTERNCLPREELEKLIHIYYENKMNDSNVSDNY